ncbi:MAG: tryptophan 2,3-dioxygenase family protein [Bacteroidota bacterium]
MEEQSQKYESIHYHTYLGLDKILTAQAPRSELFQDVEAHEEMLFIIVHQSYEIWFKQILHELDSVVDMFHHDKVDEMNIGTAVIRLDRVKEILQLLIDHIGIMETMTPMDFLDFRNLLIPASGFQSYQFRKIENILGLPNDQRMTYGNRHYGADFSEVQNEELEYIAKEWNLFMVVEDWLERTPFLKFKDFQFLDYYKKSLERMAYNQKQAIERANYLSDEEKAFRLRMVGSSDSFYQSILNPEVHRKMVAEGKQRLNYPATLAALMINLYNEEPLLHLPHRFLLAIVDIDELLTNWRYRHAQMVLRMLGRKVGTGGSSGHDYLRETAARHKIFTDLHNISTLLIPRSELPELPADLKKELGFYYTSSKDKY